MSKKTNPSGPTKKLNLRRDKVRDLVVRTNVKTGNPYGLGGGPGGVWSNNSGVQSRPPGSGSAETGCQD
jgi:hypothetical protein